MILIETRFNIPPAPPLVLSRQRLLKALDVAPDRRITLLNGPAGSGKTTLLIDWLSRLNNRPEPPAVAWLTLQREDNDPPRFWECVIHALRRAGVDLPSLDAPAPGEGSESLPAAILNTLLTDSRPVLLIFDDFHWITAPLLPAISYFVENAPQHFHVVLAARNFPALQLGRLHVQGQTAEINGEELRFTPAESTQLLQRFSGLNPDPQSINEISRQTEGWAVGLLQSAVAMRNQGSNPFPSNRRSFIHDYLAAQVFDLQPPGLQSFLLQTALPDQICAGLCHALTGRTDSQDILENLERENLFLSAVDPERTWFRYHPMFARFLNARAVQLDVGAPARQHLLASAWFASNGLGSHAIRHALAGGDAHTAASLIEQSALGFQARGEWYTLRRCIEALPEELRFSRPVLSVWHAQTLLIFGEYEAAKPCVEAARQHLPAWQQDGRVTPKDGQAFSTLLDLCAADIARQRGDTVAARAAIQSARDRLPPYRHVLHTVVAHAMCDEADSRNDTPGATRVLLDVLETNPAVDAPALYSDSLARIGRNLVLQGQVEQAVLYFEHGLELAGEHALPALGTVHLLGLGDLRREQGDLPAAEPLLSSAADLARTSYRTDVWVRAMIVGSRLALAGGDLSRACSMLDKARRMVEPMENQHFLRTVLAARVRLFSRNNDLNALSAWVRSCGLTADMTLTVHNEEQAIQLARALVWLGNLTPAGDLLARLRSFASAGGRVLREIEVLVLSALLENQLGRVDTAGQILRQAMQLAAPSGWTRVFLDEGHRLRPLIEHVAGGANPDGYAARLLEHDLHHTLSGQELSTREREVLGLLAQGLSNAQIADQLSLSLNTVIWHNQNIYRKLGVGNRTQAVAKARENHKI